MISSSCRNCFWAEWDQARKNQTDCSLGILNKLPHISLWDGDVAHNALTQNICVSFRKPEWAENKKNPKEEIAAELFPKVKMVIVIKDNSHWLIFDDKQLEEFHSVDILYFGGTTSDLGDRIHSRGFLEENKYLLDRSNFHIHYCYGELEHHLNQFAAQGDHQYYLVNTDRKWILPKDFLENLDIYINMYIKYVAMIKPLHGYHGLLVNKTFHKDLDGFGQQDIVEKIEIDKVNRGYESWVFESIDNFIAEVENGTA